MDLIFTLDTITDAAQLFWRQFNGKKIFAFYGELGSGKTTFIHALCDVKQVRSPVSSPTFSIINQYELPDGQLYHLDLYRLKNEEEAVRAGVEDVFYAGDICLIEWPERAMGVLPDDTVHIKIEVTDIQTRRVTGYDK